jgi:hypothetical protein
VVTSIQFSRLSVRESETQQERVLRRIRTESNEHFNVFLFSFNFSEWDKVRGAFASGRVGNASHDIRVPAKDPSALPAVQAQQPLEDGWASVVATDNLKENPKRFLPALEDQRGWAKLLGYEDTYQLIADTLQVNNFGGADDKCLVVTIPIYARIVDGESKAHEVSVTSRFHRNLTGLQLNVVTQGWTSSGMALRAISRETRRLKASSFAGKSAIASKTCHFKRTTNDPSSFIEAELIHRGIPVISVSKVRVRMISQGNAGMLLAALSEFCSFEVFRGHLLTPEKFKEKGFTPQKIFEEAVSWLLTLLGYSVLRLQGRFEHLVIPETKYEVGSIDLLAQKNGRLFLVDCDTSIPDSKKLNQMYGMTTYGGDAKKTPPFSQARTVVFTPRDCTQFQTSGNVTIIDGPKINRLFDNVLQDKKEDLETFLF